MLTTDKPVNWLLSFWIGQEKLQLSIVPEPENHLWDSSCVWIIRIKKSAGYPHRNTFTKLR